MVILAIQIIESIIQNPLPTLAEASDVANAIFDGTDAVMLSAETASGRYPARAGAVMDRIIREPETAELRPETRMEASPGANPGGQAVAQPATHAAPHWQARALSG